MLLPPPPPVLPPKFVPEKASASQVNVFPWLGVDLVQKGKVSIKYEDDSPVDAKGVGRKILDQVYQTYNAELAGKRFAYDGEKSLFTVGSLPQNKLDFTVVLADESSHRSVWTGSPDGSPDADRKRSKRQPHSKTGCLLVRQSFFHNEPRNFVDLGGGVVGCRGFHSSFRATQGEKREGTSEELHVTVYDYFVNHRNIRLKYSGEYPCINAGKPKRPTYIPIELCTLVSLQRYTKALSNLQRASLVEKSRQKPQERMNALQQALSSSNYAADPLLKSSGISISTEFTRIQGRVLPAPKLRVGNDEDFFPRNGRWNFNNKRFVEPIKLERWIVVNFSARCDTRKLCSDMIRCGQMKGVMINQPFDVFQEKPEFRNNPAPIRVEKMFEIVKSRVPGTPQFILCILSERKTDVYGYLGGINSLLTIEHSPSIPLVSKVPTLIAGMDVSHGSPVARRSFCCCEALRDFYNSSGSRKPDHIIIFRDGVSESQFNQVLNIELEQIIEACKFLDEHWSPKFMVVVAQKNHHTKFFQANSPDNVPPGTVIDNGICHPRTNDFYMCAHAGMIVSEKYYSHLHSCPICYAHLAAAQMSQFIKFDEMSERSPSHSSLMTSSGEVSVHPLPGLHHKVVNSMFFC
ncbi:hypothetical protein DH2020_023614 [Rehmannia glutinosa]|uniref:Piwi domain-containing protein n=1 Tax=Rehmannia glutinosa TaxID=99300 RepID=A0ABR0W9F1_REHGL